MMRLYINYCTYLSFFECSIKVYRSKRNTVFSNFSLDFLEINEDQWRVLSICVLIMNKLKYFCLYKNLCVGKILFSYNSVILFFF